jgi:hypothetical protein
MGDGLLAIFPIGSDSDPGEVSITFKTSPRQVYDIIMVSKKHQSLSLEKAKISQRVGGKFTAWGSHLSGINLVLKPGKKIVQAWRATGW